MNTISVADLKAKIDAGEKINLLEEERDYFR